MIISTKKTESELLAFVPSIKANMSEWQIMSVRVQDKGRESFLATVKRLYKIYEHKEGVILPVNSVKIMVIVRLGKINNYMELKSDLESKMPDQDARVVARKMSAMGLKQVQLNLTDKNMDAVGVQQDDAMYQQREARNKNIFLIAEDDAFVRKTLVSLLQNYGEVHEVEDGSEVEHKYLECNPDIVILDIHLPNQSGLDLLNKIVEMDMDAFVVMASADSVRENVMEAIAHGAVGFLTKPIRKEKLLEYLSQCITFKNV